MRHAPPAPRSRSAFALLAAILGRGEGALATASAREWASVTEIAGWHGLQPALRHALDGRGLLEQVPDGVHRALETARVVATLRAESRRRQLRDVLATLRDAGTPVIALKGAYLAEHAYASPALRPMSDLDLLLRGPDVPRAWAALQARGYVASPARAPARHAPALLRPGGLPVELHHTIEPCARPFTLPVDDVWSRAGPALVADTCILAPSPEDVLLHLATHMAHSHVLGASLTSVLDVLAWTDRFAGTADWDAIVRRARTSGVHPFTYAALALAHRALGAEVPPAALGALRASEADDTMVGHALVLLEAPPFVIVGARAVTNPREALGSRLRRVARALLVSPARQRLGPRLADLTDGGTQRSVERDGYLARWRSVIRLLVAPTVGWATAQQVARVRALRRWGAHGAPRSS